MSSEIDTLAKELSQVAQNSTAPSHKRKFPFTYNAPTRRRYRAIAKYVSKLVLESRLAELETIRDVPGKSLYIVDTIAEIKTDLEKL